MKKKLIPNIVLGLALCGMSVSVFAEEKTMGQTVEASEAPATTEQSAMTAESSEPATDINASATPKMSSDIEFKGELTAIGGASADMGNATPEVLHYVDGKIVDRNYFQQPPMIPHKISEYKVTIRYNKCMSCHSWDNYQKAKATKVSQTHFKDRDGKDHSTLAARRYFCNQCHVPQVDAKPLIENEFKPVDELK